MNLLQGMLDGLIGALALAPVAAAFALVYASTGVFHIAVGAVFALAPFVAISVIRLGLPPGVAFALALLAGVALSIAMEYFNHRPLARKRTTELGHFIASLGAFTVVVQVIVLVWGAEPMTLRAEPHRLLTIGSLHLSTGQVLAALIGVVALAALYAWLPLSRTGLRLQALASNPTEAALRGLNINSLRLAAFAISGALCSVASLTSAWDLGFDAFSGTTPVLLAIVAAMIGGRHSYWGPLVGILLVGVVRGITVVVLSAQWQDAAAFALLALVLIARPQGILGRVDREGARE